ncbi:MAG: hypothetical protein ABRQ34_06120 [Smithellaceae bacterium]
MQNYFVSPRERLTSGLAVVEEAGYVMVQPHIRPTSKRAQRSIRPFYEVVMFYFDNFYYNL